jgi:hypothetical protein
MNAMPTIIHYVCQREYLPMVEGALTAHGYRVEIRDQQRPNRVSALIMTRGLTTILLTDVPNQALAAIEIWGLGQTIAGQLLESLSLGLYRPSVVSPIALNEAEVAAYVG